MDAIFFFLFAAIAVIAGLSLVVQTHPISSALSLIFVMGSLAVLYLLLGAPFIAAAQLLVYAGAIMVLFVFVIMLLNAKAEKRAIRGWAVTAAAVPLLALLLGLFNYFIQRTFPNMRQVDLTSFTGGSPHDVGMAIFTKYLLPFEVTSALVLIAIIGAVVLAKKEI
jgi:NADH-quinone oxidoreductase subunit J